MEGGFFLIQHVDFSLGGQRIKGVEYVGYDQDTQTLRSQWMDITGSNFAYTWQIEGDTMTIWFGDKGSPNFMRGTFNADGNSGRRRWQWPEGDGKVGGYEFTMTRLS